MGKGKASRLRYIENFTNYGIPLPWDDFEYIMVKYYGFEMDEDTGSSGRTFSLEAETFTANKPHGKKRVEKMVHKADRQKAIRALRNLGLI
jgi:hypothetical protein